MNRSFYFIVPALLAWYFLISNNACASPDTTLFRSKVQKHVLNLCTPKMAGRGYIKKGHLHAAKYIADQYKKYGLTGLNVKEKNVYFQSFTFSVNVIEEASLTINGKTLKIGTDFIPKEDVPAGRQKLPCVDVSYGFPDDYWDKDINGKAVMITTGVPKVKPIEEEMKKKYASDQAKINLAIEKGAAAIILVYPKLTHGFSSSQNVVPVLGITQEVSGRLGIAESVSFKINAQIQKITSQNVIGMVKGTQMPDSAVVLCAHYDHLGKMGKAVFTGANDNASGTGFLLAMAEYYAKNPLPYSVIFMACGAEETGLNGSMFYVKDNPLFPLKKTKFVLNYDLMGNGEEGVMTVAGKTFTQPFQKLSDLNDQYQLINPLASRPNAPNSDHYPFTLKGVPAFFFYTQGGAKAYHDVFDQPQNLRFFAINKMFCLTDAFLKECLMVK